MARPRVAPVAEVGDVAEDGFTVVKSDDTVFNPMPRAIFVGTGGDVKIKTARGTDLTFAVPDGGYVLCRSQKVYSSGTDADGMIALY